MMKTLHFTKKDFRVDWFSGTGAGGQYRNKHQNCCRITHLESGLMATGQSNRERPANQREAFKKLAGMILAFYSDEEGERRNDQKVVRNYHFIRNEASDGIVKKDITKVMDGDIDAFIKNALGGQRKLRITGRM